MAISALVILLTVVYSTSCEKEKTNCTCEVNAKKEAYCEKRGLTSIPLCLPSFVQEIYISHNHITKLTDNILRNLTDLQSINVTDNKISTLESGTFQSLPNLKCIIMRQNKITDINGDLLKSLIDIEVFSVSENFITEIPVDLFISNVNLKELYLYRNRLSKLHTSTISKLKKLKRLNLSNNLLANLHSDIFKGNPNLRELLIAYNRIEELDSQIFSNNVKLEYLDLSGNALMSLESTIFQETSELRTLILHDNPWRCDCQMRKFVVKLIDRKIDIDNKGKCWNPNNMGDLSSLIYINITCQYIVEETTDKPFLSYNEICEENETILTIVVITAFSICIIQILFCTFFIYRNKISAVKPKRKRDILNLCQVRNSENYYFQPANEKARESTGGTTAANSDYNYIVSTNSENIYACIPENDNKYLSMTASPKIDPNAHQPEGAYTVMTGQDNQYINMEGGARKHRNGADNPTYTN